MIPIRTYCPLFDDGATEFARRDDPTLHRITDATRANVQRPEVPGEGAAKTVYQKVKASPLAQALARRAAMTGAGALVGGYLGYKAHRRKGIVPGAKAGAVAGLLFERMKTNTSSRIEFGPSYSFTLPQVAKLLGVTTELARELVASGKLKSGPVYKGHDDGPRFYALQDLAAFREAVELEAQEHPIEFASFVVEKDEDTVGRRVARGAAAAGGAAALYGVAAYARGRAALGSRAGALSPLQTAALGHRRYKMAGAALVRQVGAFLR